MTASAKQGMTRRQTIFVIVLTAAYLLVELAFNARLLDVAGGLQADAVHGLENFGRTLSGIAVALVVLQVQLTCRANSTDGSPRTIAILFKCLLAGILTFIALKVAVDLLVDARSGQFRKAAATMVIVRSEMLNGQAQLDGLADGAEIFALPEGKAFAALFPLLAVQIWDRVDQRLAPVKSDLMMRAIDRRLGGAQGFYNGPFVDALSQLRRAYQGDLPEEQLKPLFQREFEKAWADYEAQLRQHRWTPDTVPYQHHRQVAAEMNRKVGVPRSWGPGDRTGFRSAIEQRVRRQLREQPGTVYADGRAVASGLAWPAYVLHASNQARLRQALQLPDAITVRHDYPTGGDFQTMLYQPMLKAAAAAELTCLELSEESFLPGGANAERGREAAEAVIVGPVALLCSLLGAIGHFAKLLYQASRLAVSAGPMARFRRAPMFVLLGVLATAAAALSIFDNSVTRSRVHRFISEQARAANLDAPQALGVRGLLAGMHVIEIGQGYGYVVNDFVRTRVLAGYEFNAGQKDRQAQPPASRCKPVRET